MQPNFQAGCGYYHYYANELLHQNIYHADGQIQDEVYEYGSFIQSKMYHKGIKCTDCHNPHTAQLVRSDPVTLKHIHVVVMDLVALASEHGGDYDGWGAPIAAALN